VLAPATTWLLVIMKLVPPWWLTTKPLPSAVPVRVLTMISPTAGASTE